eukprot:m.109314 g.109314  ORF g.109314 m.109314 type:complete len:1017 (+) comp9038_c0_seq2:381-3431(+)
MSILLVQLACARASPSCYAHSAARCSSRMLRVSVVRGMGPSCILRVRPVLSHSCVHLVRQVIAHGCGPAASSCTGAQLPRGRGHCGSKSLELRGGANREQIRSQICAALGQDLASFEDLVDKLVKLAEFKHEGKAVYSMDFLVAISFEDLKAAFHEMDERKARYLHRKLAAAASAPQPPGDGTVFATLTELRPEQKLELALYQRRRTVLYDSYSDLRHKVQECRSDGQVNLPSQFVVVDGSSGVGKTQSAFCLDGIVLFLCLSTPGEKSQVILQAFDQLSSLFRDAVRRDVNELVPLDRYSECTDHLDCTSLSQSSQPLQSAGLLLTIFRHIEKSRIPGMSLEALALTFHGPLAYKAVTTYEFAIALRQEPFPTLLQDLVIVLDEVPAAANYNNQFHQFICLARNICRLSGCPVILMGTDSMMINFVSGASRQENVPQSETADEAGATGGPPGKSLSEDMPDAETPGRPLVPDAKSEPIKPRVWARLVITFPAASPAILFGDRVVTELGKLPPRLQVFFKQQLMSCRPLVAIALGWNIVHNSYNAATESEHEFVVKMATRIYEDLRSAKPQLMQSKYRDTGAFCLYLSSYAEDNRDHVLKAEVGSSASSHFTTNLDTNLIVGHFGMPYTNSAVACIPSTRTVLGASQKEPSKRRRFASAITNLVTETNDLFKVITVFPQREMLLWLALMFGTVADLKTDVFELYASLYLASDTRIKLTPILPNMEQSVKPDGTVNEVCTLYALAGATTIHRSLHGVPMRDCIRESLRRLGFKTDISILDKACFGDFHDAFHPLCVPPKMAQFEEFAKADPDANFAFMYRPRDLERIDVKTEYLGNSSVKRKRASGEDKDRDDGIDAKTFSEGITAFIESEHDVHYYVGNSFQDSYPTVDTALLAPTSAFLIVNAVDNTYAEFRLDVWRQFPAYIEKIFIIVPVYGRRCDAVLPILQELRFARTERQMLQKAELAAFLDANRAHGVAQKIFLPATLAGLMRSKLFELLEWTKSIVLANPLNALSAAK